MAQYPKYDFQKFKKPRLVSLASLRRMVEAREGLERVQEDLEAMQMPKIVIGLGGPGGGNKPLDAELGSGL